MLDSGRSCRVPCGEFVQELHEKCGGEVDAGHLAHSVLEAQFTAAIAVFDGPRRAYGCLSQMCGVLCRVSNCGPVSTSLRGFAISYLARLAVRPGPVPVPGTGAVCAEEARSIRRTPARSRSVAGWKEG